MTTPETTTSRGGGWPLAGLLVVVLVVVVVLNRPRGSDLPRGVEGTGPRVRLSISLPGRQIDPLELRVDEGATLLDAMHLARQRDPAWDFVTQGDGVDAFVVKLAGQTNDAQGGIFWTYDLNGELGQVGIGACQLAEGDDILWKFAPYE